MNTSHTMPFGAMPDAEGGARFQIWAPTAASVELVLEPSLANNAVRSLPLQSGADGRFSTRVAPCAAGQRYRYRIAVARSAGAGTLVPDPASRFNPIGVDGPSELVDGAAFEWDEGWHGRPWAEAVIYELHVGTFTEKGTYVAAEARLAELAALGITAVELMPLAEFAGARGWGYDGVLHFAPHANYGTPDELKHFIQAAHRLGLMVMLDVVYNHFGPAGNYLHLYAESFFNSRHDTPWGAAIGFDGDAAATVRDFYVHNALYWLEEFRFDGLRFDAVHAIRDDSMRHILDELPQRVRAALGTERNVHLVLENEENQARWLAAGAHQKPTRFEAQWNDDFHHAAHVVLTGENSGYYADYAAGYPHGTVAALARSLAEGFVYQGEASPHRDGRPRGEPSSHLPPTAFINFLQNHDQVGNRPYGDRLAALASPDALEAMTVLWLLAPAVPMFFMGEEFGARGPFRYFCDFEGDLGSAVSAGRRREIAGMLGLSSADEADPPIPDPCAESSFIESRLDWSEALAPAGRQRLALIRRLLDARRDALLPLLPGLVAGAARHAVVGSTALQVAWPHADGSAWVVQANLGRERSVLAALPAGTAVFVHRNAAKAADVESPADVDVDVDVDVNAAAALDAWSVRWLHAADASALVWPGRAA